MINHAGFVYIWYDRKRKWFCIGSHFGKTYDGYVTSTGFMNKAYVKRPTDFKRRILEYYDGTNPKELLKLEQKWLNLISVNELCIAENKRYGTVRYYNAKKTASGLNGEVASKLRKEYWESDKGQEHKKRLSERMENNNPCKPGNTPWNAGKKCPSISEGRRGKGIGNTPWNAGKKCPSISEGKRKNPTVYTDELLQKIGDFHRGRKRPEETKNKISNSVKAYIKTEDHKRNLSAAAKERSNRILTCPHCNFVGSGPAMNRWHFSNCKNI
jgi:hypothetical protein